MTKRSCAVAEAVVARNGSIYHTEASYPVLRSLLCRTAVGRARLQRSVDDQRVRVRWSRMQNCARRRYSSVVPAPFGEIGAEPPYGALRLSGGNGERSLGPLRAVDVGLLDPSLPEY